jgi:hypothetical protein
MKIVCCIDDYTDVPEAIRTIFEKETQPKDLRFYWLRMGNASDPPTDQAVDIMSDLEESRDMSARHLTATAAVESIARLLDHEVKVLFVCDLALDNAGWPPSEDKLDATAIERELRRLMLEIPIWKSDEARAGGYIIYKLSKYGFDYILTSVHFSPDMEKLGIKAPIYVTNEKSAAKAAQDIRFQYHRYFWPERTWDKLAAEQSVDLITRFKRMRDTNFFKASHNIEATFQLPSSLLDEAVSDCKLFIQELGSTDSDISFTSLVLDASAEAAKQLGVAKTRAVLQRITGEWCLFDWLDMVAQNFRHEVTLDGERMTNLRNLRPYVNKEIAFNLNFENYQETDDNHDVAKGGPEHASIDIKVLERFFMALREPEYKWDHSVDERPQRSAEEGRKIYRYRIKVTSNAPPRADAINLRKLLEGDGNTSFVLMALRKLLNFRGKNLLQYRLIVAQDTLDNEVADIQDSGLFVLVTRSDVDYKIAFFGQLYFNA